MADTDHTPTTDNHEELAFGIGEVVVVDPERVELRQLSERLAQLLAQRYAKVGGWHMRAVAERKLTHAQAWMFVVIQAFGWHGNWCRPSNATLGELAAMDPRSVRRCISQLVSAGWIEVREAGWGRREIRVTPDPTVRGGGQPGPGGRTLVSTGDSSLEMPSGEEEETPPPPSGGSEPQDAAPKAKAKRPSKPASAPPEWSLQLAREVLDGYPHRIDSETGVVRRPGPTHVARRLVVAHKRAGLLFGTPRFDEWRARLLAGLERLAKSAPVGSRERNFTKNVDTWLNQDGWEGETTAGPGGAPSTVYAEPTKRARREREERDRARAKADAELAEDQRQGGERAGRVLKLASQVGAMPDISTPARAREAVDKLKARMRGNGGQS